MKNIPEDKKKEIKTLMEQLTCSKHFKCVTSNFHNLCKAKLDKENNILLCLEKDPSSCRFLKVTSDIHICLCPLRKIAADISQ